MVINMYKYIKRFLDIFFSIILIVLTFPLMIITGIITYINLGRPIFNLLREREGENKKTFIMYKFRTKVINDTGINEYTKVSKIIDRLRLNELLQLFNILKGDMSFIGPRPFIPGDKLPPGDISYKRYLVKPGITGLAQVNGGRKILHKTKLMYDEIYYDNFGLLQDLKILFLTVIRFFKII